jgi:D-arabinose 5-phosphate isomerase GutQ
MKIRVGEKILGLANSAIMTESQGLQTLAESLGIEFVNAVSCLLSCNGRVLLAVMGKLGQIGKKTAATFASTGIPAVFVHPAEAVTANWS